VRLDDASAIGSVSTGARPPVPVAFFWPVVTQQMTRVAEVFPLRDVGAAVAGAGAFALWALALSLIAA